MLGSYQVFYRTTQKSKGEGNSKMQVGLFLPAYQDLIFILSGITGTFYIIIPLINSLKSESILFKYPVLKKMLLPVNVLFVMAGIFIVTLSLNTIFSLQKLSGIILTLLFFTSLIIFFRILLFTLFTKKNHTPIDSANSKNNFQDTERKKFKAENPEQQKESRIRESEERFKWLVESSPNAIVLTDDLGTVRLVNRQTEQLFGYERNELIGKPMEILMPERYRKNHVNYRRGYYNDPQARPMGTGRDLFGLHKIGNEIPIEIGLTPLRMQEKLMVLATIVDITERKKNEERFLQKNLELAKFNEELKSRTAQLIQSEKMSALGTLVAGVAHELNNPLTGILNYTQYCKKNIEPGSKISTILDDVIYETKRCEEIVKNLLHYSYSHETKEREIIDISMLKQVIQRVSTLFSHDFKNIRLNLFIDNNFSGFRFEKNKLQQIISNMVKNSIDAMESSRVKEINIRAFNDNSHCHLVVEDTGSGIDEENITRIFDPFYTTKEVGKGTGLGLTVIKGIVEEGNGEIKVVSKKNEGTQFHLKFPLEVNESKTF